MKRNLVTGKTLTFGKKSVYVRKINREPLRNPIPLNLFNKRIEFFRKILFQQAD